MSIRSNRLWFVMPLLVCLTIGNSAAGQLFEVRDGTTVAARISGSEPNRIVVRDGRIHKIWGAEGKVVIKPDPDSGQVYLSPTADWKNKAFSMFIRDEHGAVFTMVLTPMDIPAETVTLMRPDRIDTGARKKAVAWETEKPYEDTLLSLIKHMALDDGDLPDGYLRARVDREIPLWNEAKLVLTTRFRGGKLDGEVYELTNVDTKNMRLDEREFYRDEVLAVAIAHHELRPGETTQIFLVVRGSLQ